ncbi:teichoic acid translocation permease protein TagG [bacterium BMS3Bbin01]|nr:teichoic acid translocation permease protein TagG [bacterium BMS3Bbin01]
MKATTYYDSAQVRRPLITEFQNFWSYRGLLKLLVTRDLTVRYKRSILGVWWTLLNPLLTTAIMWFVFGKLFASRFATGEPYVVYLLPGVLLMMFFSQGMIATGAAITNASGILSKVYVPAEVFSLSTAVAAGVNLVIGLVPLFVVQLIAGVGIPWTALLIPIPVLAMLALVTGLGLLVASAAVYFYDILDITRVAVQLVYYLTPVFWPITIIPPRFLPFVKANPLFSYVDMFRDLIYRGVLPQLWELAMVTGTALGILALGVWVFSKGWRNIVGSL